MANGHGGYRKPRSPAPVSGPGALSRRTDGKQPVMETDGFAYGERQAFEAIQAAAPMSETTYQAAPMPPVVPLSSPTTRPQEPVTSGAEYGPGPGPSSEPRAGSVYEALSRMRGRDPQIDYLTEMAARLGV